MYNILQPYVNLMNASIETFSRFANAREVTDLAKDSAVKSTRVLQENVSKIGGSNAYAELTSAMIDNYVRFFNEYTQNVFGIVSQGQEFVSQQVEEGQRRLAQIADISRRTVGAAAQSAKSVGEEVESESSRTRQQRSK
jgi:hypothetical protein